MSLAWRDPAGPRVACHSSPSRRARKDQMNMRILPSGSKAQAASRDHGMQDPYLCTPYTIY